MLLPVHTYVKQPPQNDTSNKGRSDKDIYFHDVNIQNSALLWGGKSNLKGHKVEVKILIWSP